MAKRWTNVRKGRALVGRRVSAKGRCCQITAIQASLNRVTAVCRKRGPTLRVVGDRYARQAVGAETDAERGLLDECRRRAVPDRIVATDCTIVQETPVSSPAPGDPRHDRPRHPATNRSRSRVNRPAPVCFTAMASALG